jgi:hypothetical protein
MHNMNVGDLVKAAFFGLLAVYFWLGFFSSSPWLHTDGRRKSGRFVVTFTPRFIRVFCVLIFGYLAVSCFAEAFHHDFGTLGFITDIVILVGIVLLLIISMKTSKREDDPAA